MTQKAEKKDNKYLYKFLIAVLGTGILGQVFNAWDLSTQKKQSYVEKYIDCNKQVNELNLNISKINARLSLLESSSSEIPFPFWIKDDVSYIIWVNKAYQRTVLERLGIDIDDFLNTRGEVLGEDFVQQITKNDNEVLLTDKVISFKEFVPGLGLGTSYKFRIRTKFGFTGPAGS